MLTRRGALVGAAALCMPAIARAQLGQTVFSSRTSANVGGPLLDQLSATAAVAYSMRKLKAAYAGKALQVTRTSDSTTQDIGFVNGQFDFNSLATFCSGTNGNVSIWYDQSGNARNATPRTGNVQIFVSPFGFNFTGGSSSLSAGQCLNTNGGNLSNTFVNSSPSTIAMVAQEVGCAGGLFDSVGAGNEVACFTAPPNEWLLYDQTNFLTATSWDTNLHGFQSNINGSSSNLYIDQGIPIAGTQTSVPGSGQIIGGRNAAAGNLKMSEFITFTSVLSATDRNTMMNNWRAVWGTP